MEKLTESLLEMHFHHAFIELFSTVFGKKFLKLYKPSPQKEKWVGFDQGWISTSEDTSIILKNLKNAINNNTKKFYLAYFFQFKTVQLMHRNSRFKPPHFTFPYFRSELNLKPNKETHMSQHETLLRLSNYVIPEVYYACPMIFNNDDIYEEPNLDKIRFIQVNSAPNGWQTNDRHFILFQSEDDLSPFWYSEPIKAVSFSIEQLIDSKSIKLLNPLETSSLLNKTSRFFEKFIKEKPYKYFPETLTLIEFENIDNN